MTQYILRLSVLPEFTGYLAKAGPSAISHTILCQYINYSSGAFTYSNCDASDDTVLNNGAYIT